MCFFCPPVAEEQRRPTVDTEHLKAVLRKAGINIDKILADDMRAFRRSLRQR